VIQNNRIQNKTIAKQNQKFPNSPKMEIGVAEVAFSIVNKTHLFLHSACTADYLLD